MKLINNELIVAFDIDNTLVFDCEFGKHGSILVDYYGNKKSVRMHFKHIELLRSFKKRGYFIIANSANGGIWAENVIKALGLEDQVDICMTKIKSYVDDLPCEKWMVDHIYIPEPK